MYNANVNNQLSYYIGVDEVGRGPLAGPVTLGIVRIPCDFDTSLFAGVRDSKQVSKLKREEWFEKIKEWEKEGLLSYRVTHVGNEVIDRVGISQAIRIGIYRALKFFPEKNTYVYLDGLLKAPKRFCSQETVIKGDEKIPIISIASICAKVERDRKMDRYGKIYPTYGFGAHKGYGTHKHRKALKKHGLSPIHRKYFCKKYSPLAK